MNASQLIHSGRIPRHLSSLAHKLQYHYAQTGFVQYGLLLGVQFSRRRGGHLGSIPVSIFIQRRTWALLLPKSREPTRHFR
jgi:hypothetical protein